MSVYMIIDVRVHNRETYAEYVKRVAAVVKAHRGRYLSQGGKVTPLASEWTPQRIVLIEFPTIEQLEQCFASEEYRGLAPLRERSTTSRGIVVEGCAASAPTSNSCPAC